MYFNLVILLLLIFFISLLNAQLFGFLLAHPYSFSFVSSSDFGTLYMINPNSKKFAEIPSESSPEVETSTDPTPVEVVDPDVEGMAKDTQEIPETTSSEVEKTVKTLPIIGEVSLDYSRIDSGWIIILCNSFPMLSINIQWLLAMMSRSSRRRLAKWLDSKELSGFPIGTSDNSPSSTPSSITDGLSISDSSSSAEKTKPTVEISESKILLVKKLSRILNVDLSPGSISNSLADSLRQLMKSGSVKFAIKNNLLNPQHTHPDNFKVVEFVVLLELAKKNLTSRRGLKKTRKVPKTRTTGTSTPQK